MLVSAAVAGCGLGRAADTPQANGSATTPVPPVATSTGAPASPTWAAADLPGIGGGATTTLSAVLAPVPGRGWMIAGTATSATGTSTAEVWTSTDARHWRAVALPGADGRAMAATVWGSRVVVVGSVGPTDGRRAAVWLSDAPGEPFRAVVDAPALDPTPEPSPVPRAPEVTGTSEMDLVAAGTIGVFAAGSVSGRTGVWYSTNGIDWARVSAAEAAVEATVQPTLTALVVTTFGVYLAGTVKYGSETDAVYWISGDGIHWHLFGAAPFSGSGDHAVDALVELSGTLVAAGGVRSGRDWIPASWVSPDGGLWTQPLEDVTEPQRPQPDDGGAVVRAVAPAGTGLVAVGGSDDAQYLWSSVDGKAWAAAPMPPAIADAAGWTADLVADDGQTAVIADDEVGQPHVVVDDGGAWTDVTATTDVFGSPRPSAVPAAVVADAAAGGWLLFADVTRPGRALGVASDAVEVLASADGRSWRPAGRRAVIPDAVVDAAVVTAGGVVAVGDAVPDGGADTTAAVPTSWTSAAGGRWVPTPVLGPSAGAAATTAPATRRAPTTTTAAATTAAAATTGAASPPAEPRAATAAVPLDGGVVVLGSLPASSGTELGTTAGAELAGAGPVALDAPSLGDERIAGACSGHGLVVAVGETSRTGVPLPPRLRPKATPSPTTTVVTTGTPAAPAGQADDGTLAAAWSSSDATSWSDGVVSPETGSGAAAEMLGCAPTTTGFVAYGQASSRSGADVAALWTSTDGRTWTRVDTPSLTQAGAAALTDLATGGPTWVAASGAPPVAVAASDDPGRPAGDPLRPPGDDPAASGPDGAAALWASTDDGVDWTRVVTASPVFAGVDDLATDLVVDAGGLSIVAGSVDGHLAVWTTPDP